MIMPVKKYPPVQHLFVGDGLARPAHKKIHRFAIDGTGKPVPYRKNIKFLLNAVVFIDKACNLCYYNLVNSKDAADTCLRRFCLYNIGKTERGSEAMRQHGCKNEREDNIGVFRGVRYYGNHTLVKREL